MAKKKEDVKFHIPKSVEEEFKKMKEQKVDRIDNSINSIKESKKQEIINLENYFGVKLRRISKKKDSRFLIGSEIMMEYFSGKGKAPEVAKKLIEDTPAAYKGTSARAFIFVLKRLEKIDGSKLKIFLDNVKIGQLKSDWTGIEWEY